MRKNGINRELTPIEGGVCAPSGYKANAVCAGIRRDGTPDFAMIFSEKRCAVGCVYATGKTQGAPVKVSKRNMRNGYARAILVNGGIANAIDGDGEKLALSVCDLLFPYGVERTETVIASTGYIGKRLELSAFQQGINALWQGLSSSEEQSRLVAQAIRGEECEGKQLSFAFDLGDYPCKIGAVFKGGKVNPNMATFLAFLTTDVNISSPMLQKALEAEVRETLNLLNIGNISSPNDTVCIFANGRAGNYKIDCADSEYKKFSLALRLFLREICKEIAKEGAQTLLTCNVKGARSKEVARSIAKTLVGSEIVKESIARRKMNTEGILFSILERVSGDAERMRLSLRSKKGEIVFYEEGSAMPPSYESLERICSAQEVELCVSLREGNFQALAFGQIKF